MTGTETDTASAGHVSANGSRADDRSLADKSSPRRGYEDLPAVEKNAQRPATVQESEKSSGGVATIKPTGPSTKDSHEFEIDNAYSPDSLSKAVAAAQSGNRPLARLYLEQAIELEPTNPNCWLWLAWIADCPATAISALEQARRHNASPSLIDCGLAWARGMQDFEFTAPDAEQFCVQVDDEAAEAEDPKTRGKDGADELAEVEPTDAEPSADEQLKAAETPQPVEPEILAAEGSEPDAPAAETIPPVERDSDTHVFENQVSSVESQNDVTSQDSRATEVAPNQDQASDVAPPASTAQPTGQPTILAIDDSPTILSIVCMSLKKHGYNVVTAADGMDALNRLESCHPALILMDINMPRLNGYQLCKLLKKHQTMCSIPVIMLSGKDGVFDKLRGKLCGCDDYITKPFESAELVQKVSEYLTKATTNA